MKKIRITLFLIAGTLTAWSQTNTFPTSGNVGIGTTSPDNLLVIEGNDTDFEFGNRNIQLNTYNTAWNSYPWLGFYHNNVRGALIGLGVPGEYIQFKLENGTDLRVDGGNLNIKNDLIIDGYIRPDGGAVNIKPDNQYTGLLVRKFDSDVYGNLKVTETGFGLAYNSYNPTAYVSTNGDFIVENSLTVNGTIEASNISIDGSPLSGAWIESANNIYYTSGQVGIGTTTFPSDIDYRLAVDGKAVMEEVKVQLSDQWPDYVFRSNYELRTLQETKEFIAENKHLPEIPSAKEVEKNGGINLGDMNMRLLKKIEELTLYQIELLERLEKAEEKIAQLENEK